MLNCLCCQQMENNMFVLLNNFETFIFLSKNIFHGGFNTNAKEKCKILDNKQIEIVWHKSMLEKNIAKIVKLPSLQIFLVYPNTFRYSLFKAGVFIERVLKRKVLFCH